MIDEYADERCDICNGELSACGPQNVGGEPSMDCKFCRLTDEFDGLKSYASHSDDRNWELRQLATSLVTALDWMVLEHGEVMGSEKELIKKALAVIGNESLKLNLDCDNPEHQVLECNGCFKLHPAGYDKQCDVCGYGQFTPRSKCDKPPEPPPENVGNFEEI
jgi:hypothetical protein